MHAYKTKIIYSTCFLVCLFILQQRTVLSRFLKVLKKSTQSAKTESDMMAEIGDVLRNAPNHPGGSNYKEQLLRLFREEQLPTFMKYFEKIQTQNRCGQGWFVGEEMTWADLAFVVYTTSWLEGIDVTPVWADYPLLAAIKDKVEALPQLEKWFKQRPRTSF